MVPKRRPKYQILLVTVPNATPATTLIENNIRLDPDFKFCTGVAVSIGSPGTLQGPSYVDIGLRDSVGMVHDDCHIENWQASSAVRPDWKFKTFKIPTDGRNVFARVTTPALTTAQFQIQFIFRLEDSLEVVAATAN